MIQSGGGACFAHETFATIRSLTGCRQDLDGDFAAKLEIGGAKDGAHAAATELGVEPVAFAQDRAGSGGNRRAHSVRKDARLLGIEHVLKHRTSHKKVQRKLATKRHISHKIKLSQKEKSKAHHSKLSFVPFCG